MTLRILQQTTMAGQRSAQDNEFAMATVWGRTSGRGTSAQVVCVCVCEGGEEEWDLTAASAGTNHSHFTLSCIHWRTMAVEGGFLIECRPQWFSTQLLQRGAVLQDARRGPFQDAATGTSQCVSAACAISAEHPRKAFIKEQYAWREKHILLVQPLGRMFITNASYQTFILIYRHVLHQQ